MMSADAPQTVLLLGTLPCHRGQYHRRGHRASHRQDQLSATGRPSARRQRMSMWYPNDSNAVMLTHTFGRARCNRSNSCGLMSCVRLKGVEEVLSSTAASHEHERSSALDSTAPTRTKIMRNYLHAKRSIDSRSKARDSTSMLTDTIAIGVGNFDFSGPANVLVESCTMREGRT
jgi:hypothetical protein